MSPIRLAAESRETSAPLRELRGLLPAAMVAEAADTLCDMLRAMGGAGEDLDAVVDDLAARDRPRLSAVYDAMRQTAVFRRIVTAEPLLQAASAMVGAERLHSPFEHAVFRMDLAGESWRGFGWHQDFPYNVLCPKSVTAWLPLTPSGAINGGVEVAMLPDERLYPVDIRFKRDAEGRRLSTRDAFISQRFHSEFEACAHRPEVRPGDVLMFRNTVVHRSGRNPGPRHRYSIQVRFGNLLAAEVLQRRWRHRQADGFDTFAALHPELVAFEEA